MWKLSRGRVLLDEPPEEEDGPQGAAPPGTAGTPAPARAQVGARVLGARWGAGVGRCLGPRARS